MFGKEAWLNCFVAVFCAATSFIVCRAHEHPATVRQQNKNHTEIFLFENKTECFIALPFFLLLLLLLSLSFSVSLEKFPLSELFFGNFYLIFIFLNGTVC